MNNFDADTLLKAFPLEVSQESRVAMIAAIVAEELEQLSSDHDLLLIYAQIDELDDTMLDILAYDFKIDWWDANATLAKKREVFKSHFAVHRTLGTIGAVKRALSDMYVSSRVSEWHEYNGMPYHYKLDVDLGEEFGISDILHSILLRTQYYTNVRSVLENITFHTSRTRMLLYGCGLIYGSYASYAVDGLDLSLFNFLTDEDGVILTDDSGIILIE